MNIYSKYANLNVKKQIYRRKFKLKFLYAKRN